MCTPTYACIFMDKVETQFLEKQTDKPFCWVRNIDDIFFIWTHGQEKLKIFQKINKFYPNLKFTSDSREENVGFLGLKVKLKQGKIETDLHVKPTADINTFIPLLRTQSTLSDLQYLVSV